MERDNKIIHENNETKEDNDGNNNRLLDNNDVDVDILPKVGGNSIIIYVCSCLNLSWSYAGKHK